LKSGRPDIGVAGAQGEKYKGIYADYQVGKIDPADGHPEDGKSIWYRGDNQHNR